MRTRALLILTLLPVLAFSQNKIQNSSFETGGGLNGPLLMEGNFFYFNNQPDNQFGRQYPKTGEDYIGMVGYDPSNPITRHYIIGKLDPPAVPGDDGMYAEASISLADSSFYSSGWLGFRFFSQMPDTSILFSQIPHIPMLPAVVDTGGWVTQNLYSHVTDTFRYWAFYVYSNGAFTQQIYNGNAPYNGSFYYIDDICVRIKTDSLCEVVPVGVKKPQHLEKRIISITDLLGRPADKNSPCIKVIRYSDGTFKKTSR